MGRAIGGSVAVLLIIFLIERVVVVLLSCLLPVVVGYGLVTEKLGNLVKGTTERVFRRGRSAPQKRGSVGRNLQRNDGDNGLATAGKKALIATVDVENGVW